MTLALPYDIRAKLLPYQVQPAEHLLSLAPSRHVLDFSDTGTGKMFLHSAVNAVLQQPTLVVCPLAIVTEWKRTAAFFGDSISVAGYDAIRTGNTPFGRWTNPPPRILPRYYRCTICQLEFDPLKPEPCPYHPTGMHCLETKVKKFRRGKFIWHPNIRRIVFDEVHRCNGSDSLNADLVEAAVQSPYVKAALLSATAADSPMHLSAIGLAAGLHFGGDSYYKFLRRHGCGKLPPLPGFRWLVGKEQQQEIMRKLNHRLFPATGVRMRIAEIPGFPERQIIVRMVDIDADPKDFNAAYLQALLEKEQLDLDMEVTRQLRTQQRLELFKVKALVERANHYLELGFSVVIFVGFGATMQVLKKELNTDCYIDGTQTGWADERDRQVARFQNNESRIILVNKRAGGIGLGFHDLHGGHPRAGLILPDFSARDLIQNLGRLPRSGSKSRSIYEILYAAGTDEYPVGEKLDRKIKSELIRKNSNLEALNDGDLRP